MECLVGSVGVHLDADLGFLFTYETFSSMFLGPQLQSLFFFPPLFSESPPKRHIQVNTMLLCISVY